MASALQPLLSVAQDRNISVPTNSCNADSLLVGFIRLLGEHAYLVSMDHVVKQTIYLILFTQKIMLKRRSLMPQVDQCTSAKF